METLALAFGVVFLAELGDKSQLMALALATRYPAFAVLITVGVATAIIMGISVVVGMTIAAAVPRDLLTIVAAILFFVFAIVTLRTGSGDDEEVQNGDSHRPLFALFAAGVTFILAEIGDKTMLATATIATQGPAFFTWAGATAGMVAADGIAILVGRAMGRTLPRQLLRRVAALAFAACGIALLVQGLIT